MIVHLRPHTRRSKPACGLTGATRGYVSSWSPSDVTCGRCKLTSAFSERTRKTEQAAQRRTA